MAASFSAHKRILARKKAVSSITLGELDRAMNAYQESLNQHHIPVKAVFAALKSFEKDRGLSNSKGVR